MGDVALCYTRDTEKILDCENMSDGYLYESEVLFYVGVSFEHNASHSNYYIQNMRDISITYLFYTTFLPKWIEIRFKNFKYDLLSLSG